MLRDMVRPCKRPLKSKVLLSVCLSLLLLSGCRSGLVIGDFCDVGEYIIPQRIATSVYLGRHEESLLQDMEAHNTILDQCPKLHSGITDMKVCGPYGC